MLLYSVFTYLFYAFVVKTKITLYLYIVTPFGAVFIAVFIAFICNLLAAKKWTKNIIIFIFCLCVLEPSELWDSFQPNKVRDAAINYANIYKHLEDHLPKGINVVINTNAFENIDIMFYNKHLIAYACDWGLNKKDFDDLERRKIPIACFENRGSDTLPDFIKNYKYLYVINQYH